MSGWPTNGSVSSQSSDNWWDDGAVDELGFPAYDPTARVDRYWQNVQLSSIFVADILASQVAAACLGGGLHWKNVQESVRQPLFVATISYAGYFVVTSFLKISICCCFLKLLPEVFLTFRRLIKLLCLFILGLGLFEACIYVFNCSPFKSNFIEAIIPDHCINLGAARWCWVAISVAIDLLLIVIPFVIIHSTRLKTYERRALIVVFTANLLGTCTCLVSLYGIWNDRALSTNIDGLVLESPFIVINNWEMLMYTIGATFPVLGPFFVRHGRERAQDEDASKPSMLSSLLRRLRHPFSSQRSTSFRSDEVPSFVIQGQNPSDLEKGEPEGPTLIKTASPVHIRAVQQGKHGKHDIIQGWTLAMESRVCDDEADHDQNHEAGSA